MTWFLFQIAFIIFMFEDLSKLSANTTATPSPPSPPSFFIYLLIGSNFTVKANIQDVTKVTGTINKNTTINKANHH